MLQKFTLNQNSKECVVLDILTFSNPWKWQYTLPPTSPKFPITNSSYRKETLVTSAIDRSRGKQQATVLQRLPRDAEVRIDSREDLSAPDAVRLLEQRRDLARGHARAVGGEPRQRVHDGLERALVHEDVARADDARVGAEGPVEHLLVQQLVVLSVEGDLSRRLEPRALEVRDGAQELGDHAGVLSPFVLRVGELLDGGPWCYARW